MKKSLIALAVMAASGASFAQSSVTLYGIADIWFGSVKSANSSTTTVLNSGGVSSSRWGLKGSEDLGGGLKANFVFEQEIYLDTGAAKSPSFMNAWVGFSGGFGEVKMGRVGTALDDIGAAANSAFDSALSPQNNVWKSTDFGATNNTLRYTSPSMSGFSGTVSYSLDEDAVGGKSATSFNVKYEGGPLYVGLGFQSDELTNASNSTDQLRLNGTYNLGMAKILAGYGKIDYAAGGDTTDFQLGADVPLSSTLTLSGGFAMSEDNGAAGNAERTGYALAAAYAMSKRTTLYGGFHTSSTKDTDAKDQKIFAVGVKHTF